MSMKHRSVAVALAGALMGLCAGPAAAQSADNYPNRPIRVLVPYAPGGATDITARQLGQKLSEAWGQPVIIDNRSGASGNIALEAAARANPDGYTMQVGNVSTNAINESAFAKVLTFKPSRELLGVTNLIELPHLFIVSTAVPANSVREFIDYAKKTPGLNYGSAGVASYPHLDAARFLKAAGIEMTHIPYKGGGAQMITSTIGNEAQYIMVNMASSLPHVRAGRMKALATTWPTRRQELPNTPTMAESGFPGIGTNAWNGLFVPAKLPKPILTKIHQDVLKIMETPEMRDLLGKSFMSVSIHKQPGEFQQFVEEEVKKWGAVIRDNNIRLE